jgi:glycosyltransferase involved in cell wall biosynthesis
MTEARRNSPDVSILIPVYNRKLFIADCIQSVLDQTYQDFEVVVVDNASEDGTWDICQQFAAKDQRVRVFQNETNIGAVRNWLRCISLAKGTYGKILFSDDLILPSFLEKTIPLLEVDQECAFVYTAAEIFSESGVIAAKAYTSDSDVMKSDDFIRRSLKDANVPVSPGCALFRMEDLRKNLLLSVPNRGNVDITEKGAGSDLLIYLLTANDYDHVRIINEPLSRFRAHPGSITIHEQSRITPYYDLAKIWFASQYINDKRLLAEFNTQVYLRTLLNKHKVRGLNSLDDYYSSDNSKNEIRIIVLVTLVVDHMLRTAWRFFKRLRNAVRIKGWIW